MRFPHGRCAVSLPEAVHQSRARLTQHRHFSEKFTDKWVEGIREEFGKDIFFVGEYFSPDVKQLQNWLDKMHRKFCLFDAPLMYNLSKLSTTADSDMRKVFDKTLVQEQPTSAVVRHILTCQRHRQQTS